MIQGLVLVNKLFIILSILLISSTAYGVTVSTKGDLETALAAASPGDTIYITDGTYDDFCSQASPLNITVSGTSGNQITIAPETSGGVTFTGNFNLNIGATGQETQGDYISIKNFKFSNIDTAGLSLKVIYVYGDNAVIENSLFENCAGPSGIGSIIRVFGESVDSEINRCSFTNWSYAEAITFLGANDNNPHIHHCYFTHPIVGNHDSAIYVGNDYINYDVNLICEYNLFYQCLGDAETISNKSDENTYRYNVFRNGESLTLRRGDDCIIDSNYFYSNPNNAIRVWGQNHDIINNYFVSPGITAILARVGTGDYAQIVNLDIINNTIVDADPYYAIWIGYGTGTAPNGINIKNNLIDQSVGTIIKYESGTNITWTTNLLYNNGTATYFSGIADPGAPGVTKAVTNLVQGTYIKRLSASSTNAIELGTVDALISDDIDAGTRDVSTPDIGCDEYGADGGLFPIFDNYVGNDWAAPTFPSSGPSGTIACGPVLVTVNTSETANVRIGTTDEGSYAAMPADSMDSTDATSHTLTLSPACDATYTYYAYAIDPYGNPAGPETITFTLDTGDPPDPAPSNTGSNSGGGGGGGSY